MTERPIFLPSETRPFVFHKNVSFVWVCGLSRSQKQKRVRAFHAAAIEEKEMKILEVSSSSEVEIGVQLSAFNLKVSLLPEIATVEGVYQSSRVYRNFGPNPKWLHCTGKEIKKEINSLKKNGIIDKNESPKFFELNGEKWVIHPTDLFFNWVYMNGLWELEQKNPGVFEELLQYDAFTDINFTPATGTNCQAKAVAKYMGMKKSGLNFEELFASPAVFAEKIHKISAYTI